MHLRIKSSAVRKRRGAPFFFKHFCILLRVHTREVGGSSSDSPTQAVQWCCKAAAASLVLHRAHLVMLKLYSETSTCCTS